MRKPMREIIGILVLTAVMAALFLTCANDYDKAWDENCYYKAETGTYFCEDEEEDEDEG